MPRCTLPGRSGTASQQLLHPANARHAPTTELLSTSRYANTSVGHLQACCKRKAKRPLAPAPTQREGSSCSAAVVSGCAHRCACWRLLCLSMARTLRLKRFGSIVTSRADHMLKVTCVLSGMCDTQYGQGKSHSQGDCPEDMWDDMAVKLELECFVPQRKGHHRSWRLKPTLVLLPLPVPSSQSPQAQRWSPLAR